MLFPIQSICLSGFKLRIKFIPRGFISVSLARDVIRGAAADQDPSRGVALLGHLGVLDLGAMDHPEARHGVPAPHPGWPEGPQHGQGAEQGPLGRH